MRSVLLAAVLCAAPIVAQAQAWQAASRQCAEQYANWWLATHGARCVSCSAGWPVIARCTAATVYPGIDPKTVEACLHAVNDRDWNLPMSHDRIGDTVECLRQRGEH
jgi:hypothetical protein